MKLTLNRIYKGETYTIGRLYIDGEYFCDTIEDTDRGLNDNMLVEEIKKIKKAGVTAIPTGIYKIVMNVISPKYSQVKYQKQYGYINGKLPRLVNVKGYDGILIHIGNTAKDTDGCILVGENKVKGQVINSTDTFKRLYKKLEEAKDEITIEIK